MTSQERSELLAAVVALSLVVHELRAVASALAEGLEALRGLVDGGER